MQNIKNSISGSLWDYRRYEYDLAADNAYSDLAATWSKALYPLWWGDAEKWPKDLSAETQERAKYLKDKDYLIFKICSYVGALTNNPFSGDKTSRDNTLFASMLGYIVTTRRLIDRLWTICQNTIFSLVRFLTYKVGTFVCLGMEKIESCYEKDKDKDLKNDRQEKLSAYVQNLHEKDSEKFPLSDWTTRFMIVEVLKYNSNTQAISNSSDELSVKNSHETAELHGASIYYKRKIPLTVRMSPYEYSILKRSNLYS